MALDFTKIAAQVSQMGRSMANQNLSLVQRVAIALEHFANLPSNAVIQERVKLARVRDAGYRGVAPISVAGEALNSVYPCPALPQHATLIAADGSQIYPDQHSAAFYYLTNVGVFTYFYGEPRLPEQISEPQLFYSPEETHDRMGNLIKNALVNAQRSIREMQSLADHAWHRREEGLPIVALYDGPLLFWLGQEVLDAPILERDYYRALLKLHDTHISMGFGQGGNVTVAGYTDRPTSRFVIALLHLLSLAEEDIERRMLEMFGQYEGLTDYWLFREVLQAGERSALMIQQSPQNKHYKVEVGEDYEIAFFYVNVAQLGAPYIARVEIPMWVASVPALVNQVHALVVSQCEIMGSYPYALTRADELAVVRGAEKQALEDMIRTELLRNEQTFEDSSKLVGKQHTRAEKRRFGDHLHS